MFKESGTFKIDVNLIGVPHPIFKESKSSDIDINWTGAFFFLFNESKRPVNESSEFNVLEPLDVIVGSIYVVVEDIPFFNDFSELAESLCEVFGDVYAVHEDMRSFSKPTKSHSESALFDKKDFLKPQPGLGARRGLLKRVDFLDPKSDQKGFVKP